MCQMTEGFVGKQKDLGFLLSAQGAMEDFSELKIVC